MTQPLKPKSKWPHRILLAVVWAITLMVLFHVEENWRGERAWNNYRVEQEAKGVPLRFAEFVPPRVPDAQNFAATPFLAATLDFQPGTRTPRDTNAFQRAQNFALSIASASFKGRWTMHQELDLAAFLARLKENSTNAASIRIPPAGATRAEAALAVLAVLEPCAPVLEELRAASRRPHSRFNLAYDTEPLAGMLMPHLIVMKRAGGVLELRGSAELAMGKTEAAFEDLNLILRLADALRGEPTLISMLVRIAVLGCAEQVTWEGLADSRWNEAQLQALQTRLSGFDLLAEYKRALQAERAGFGIDTIEFLMNSIRRSQTFALVGGDNFHASLAADAILAVFPRGWFRFEELNYNLLFDRYCLGSFDASAGKVFPAIAEESKKLTRTPADLFRHRLFLNALMPEMPPLLQRVAVAQTSLSQAMLACALERHRLATGKFPDSLDALVPRLASRLPHDLITSGPLKYRRKDETGFVVYSVGWDAKDDGGLPGLKKSGMDIDFERGDWVWER